MTPETCDFCGTTSQDASNEGWTPSYWHDGAETFRPVCRTCTASRLTYCPSTGDYETTDQPRTITRQD